MAHFDKKSLEVRLDGDDREVLKQSIPESFTSEVMNKIIYGNEKGMFIPKWVGKNGEIVGQSNSNYPSDFDTKELD